MSGRVSGISANNRFHKSIFITTILVVFTSFFLIPVAQALPVDPWGDWWPRPGPPIVPPSPPKPPTPWWEYGTRLYQNDPFWADVKLDNTNKTLAEFGCTLTCFTMAINTDLMEHNFKKSNGDSMFYTPDEINEMLKNFREQWSDGTTRDGFQSIINPDGSVTPKTDGQFDAHALFSIVENDVQQKTGRTFQMETFDSKGFPNGLTLGPDNDQAIQDALNNKKSVVVRINNNTHTVLLTNINEYGQYEIWDPFCKTPPDQWNDNFLKNEFLQQWYNPSTIEQIWQYDIINFVPEPGSVLLLGLGALLLNRRNRKTA